MGIESAMHCFLANLLSWLLALLNDSWHIPLLAPLLLFVWLTVWCPPAGLLLRLFTPLSFSRVFALLLTSLFTVLIAPLLTSLLSCLMGTLLDFFACLLASFSTRLNARVLRRDCTWMRPFLLASFLASRSPYVLACIYTSLPSCVLHFLLAFLPGWSLPCLLVS